MKKIVAILCILFFVSISGCALLSKDMVDYSVGVMSLKVESELLYNQYESMYNLVSSKKENFTEEEWDQLMDVHFAFSETASRIDRMLKNPKEIVTPQELRQIYELAFIGYTNAKEIIINHRDQFSNYQWAQMENFDLKAIAYDKQVRAILDNPDNDDINMTLGAIITLGGITYKYLLPVLVSML